MSGIALATAASVATTLTFSPYLARLVVSVPDRSDRRWWLGRRAAKQQRGWAAATAVALGALAGAAAGWGPMLPAFIVLALVATPLTLIDVQIHRLPNRLIVSAGAAAAVLLAMAAAVGRDWSPYTRSLEASGALLGILLAIQMLSSGALGTGDVKLGGVLGAYLGWEGWRWICYGILGSFVIGAAAALALLASRRATRKSRLPFGPALIVGTLSVLALHAIVPIG